MHTARDLYSLYTNTYNLKAKARTDLDVHQMKALRLLFMIVNKTKNPYNSGYQPKTRNNSKQHFAVNGWFS